MRTLLLLLVGSAVLLGACQNRLPVPERKPTQDPRDFIDEARKAEIEAYPWPDYVTGEERNKIEQALRVIWEQGGRDARDAETYIVRLDEGADAKEFRAVGRLISEMKASIDKHGVDNYEGKSRIMVLDRMLRKIDGVQERLFGDEYGLDIDESANRALRLVRQWNWWYREGRFMKRYAPWDPRIDMVDEEEE